MRGLFLLLASVCVANASIPRSFSEKEDIDFSSISEWLNFDLTYDEELTPLVSVLCAPLDYLELSVIPGWPQETAINKLQKSLCSKLPRDMRLDFSYFKQCLNDSACFETQKMDILVGLTDENVFFSHYNIETVPKAQIVSACLNEQESCPTKNEAEHLLAEWKTLLQNCDSVEDKQQLKEAVDGVSNVAFKSRNDSLSNWYQEKVSDCLILTPSVDIKRMMAEKLEPTAACSEQVRDKLLEFVETEWNAPMDVAMTVTRQLMSCENETLALMVEDMLLNNDNSYQTGYAVWETMKMMADERYQLRKKRDAETSYEKTLNAVVSNSELQDKWNSAPFTWKYSYTLPETAWTSKTIYTAIITIDTSAEKPLATVRLSEVISYPPIENHVVIALESELMAELNKFVNGEFVDITQVYRYMTEQGFFIPFKLSVTMMSDGFDADREELITFLEEYMSQLANILDAFSQLPDLGRIALDKIGNTDAGIDLSFEKNQDGGLVTVAVRQPDGSDLAEVTLTVEMTENEEGMPGFSLTGKASVFGEELTRYDVTMTYEPLTENLKGNTQCEMNIEIYDETSGQSVMSVSSCVRPVYMSDPKEPLHPLANVYRTLEIPNWLHMNFTLDFGTNGFLGFVSTPKTFLFNVHYLDNLVAELTAKLELQMDERRSSSKRKAKAKAKERQPMFRTVTSAEVRVPSVSERAAGFEMSSKMFEDFSAASVFHMNTFMDVDGLVKVYDGILDASSCAPGMEDLMTGLMFTGTMQDMPEEICYDVTLHLPRQMGTLNQRIKYVVVIDDFYYTYDLDMTPSDVALKGELSLTGEEDVFTCLVSSPVEAEIKISNQPVSQFPDLTQKVNYFEVCSEGAFVKLEPVEGFCDEGFAGSFSIVDHSSVLDSDALDNYALCTFDAQAAPFMGKFNCDLKCAALSKKLSLSNDGEKFEVNTQCDYGSAKVNMDMEKVWGSFSDESSTQVAEFVLDLEEPEVVVKVVPGLSGESGVDMCTLVEYEGGEPTEDILNRQCLNETLANTNWVEYLTDDVSEFLESIDLEHPSERSVESITELALSLYEKLLAHYEEYVY